MKKNAGLLLICCIMVYAASAQKAKDVSSVKIGELVRMIDTSRIPMVINFWATWCKPCIEEIPWIEKQVNSLDGVKLILVSLDFADSYPAKLQAFIDKNAYSSQVLWLDEKDADALRLRIDKSWKGNLPVTLFVNRSKNYRHFVGQQLSAVKLESELQRLVHQ